MTGNKRPGRPPAAEAPASLTDIFSAALRVFSEKGFDGTSVGSLNRELGGSHNLVHRRFGSKEALWYATVDWAFGQIADELSEYDGLAAPDALAAVRAMVLRFLEVHAKHPEILRLVAVEGAAHSPRLTYLYEAHIAPLHARLTAPLKPLVDQGVLSEVDVRSLHFLIAHGATAPFSLVPFARMLDPTGPLDPKAVRAHAEFVADLVVAGLRARGAGNG
ncbi:TetR/AcrR family transcriptional regulator [Mycobacterium sp.]|uniref:TetR/AcrR family transcriptional regulator n=1 Tax=Mycobacterium sp. TaxID=1785 RepID=UPI002C2E0D74|nr:TetR/AcrR family transcriptional regulator [Mycobacterium sp.]HTY31777.1 TetR/AcrR family transcriptional regulator [Mycobacterium sp.]HUO38163.1 TetR/AcrR family transcriptional regulator [Mycobacterium sp.]